jgi:hypothetical protein
MKRVTEGWPRAGRFAALAVAAVLAVGCAAAPTEAERRERIDETVAGILSEPLPDDAYDTSRRCISRASIRDFEVLSDRHLLFEGPRGTFWLNELRGRCPGLNRHRTLVFEAHGMQLCDMDQITVTDLWYWPRYQRWPWQWIDGVRCSLGRFQPVTEDQADALREALRAR